MTTRPDDHRLKPDPGRCLEKNSCLNRHLGGIRITFPYFSVLLCLCASVRTCVGWLFGHLHRQSLCFGSVRSSLLGPAGAKNNVGMGSRCASAFSPDFSSAVAPAAGLRQLASGAAPEACRCPGTDRGLDTGDVLMGPERQPTAEDVPPTRPRVQVVAGGLQDAGTRGPAEGGAADCGVLPCSDITVPLTPAPPLQHCFVFP